MKKLTLIKSPQACKTFVLENDKIVSKTTPIYDGIAHCFKWETLEDLLPYLNSDCALIHGIPRQDLNCRTGIFELTTLKNENTDAKRIARARKNFVYDDETIVLLDIDEPEDAGYKFNNIHTLIQDLRRIYPVLEGKELVAAPSSSNGLMDSRTDLPLKEGSDAKWHIYFRIKSHLIPAFRQYLNDFAWVKGYGYAHVSRSGAILQRCIVDLTVFSPERIDYIGRIKDETGLIVEDKPEPVFEAGDVITEIPNNPHTEKAEQLYNEQRQSVAVKAKVFTQRKNWLGQQVEKGKLALTLEQIDAEAMRFAERKYQYDVLPIDSKIKVGKKELTPQQISEQLRNLKGRYCADPFTGEDCKCKIVAAPYATFGFMLFSYKTQSYYYFGEHPTPISEAQMKMGEQNIRDYLAKMPGSPTLNFMSLWRQAAHINNQWYNFWESYNGITTIANILLAQSEFENADVRANANAKQIIKNVQNYYADPTNKDKKITLFVGNPGNAKSYAANIAISKLAGASIFITNTNKNMKDFSESAFEDFFNVYGNTNILWKLLKKQFGYTDEDKKRFDDDVSLHYAEDRKHLFNSLEHWFRYKLTTADKCRLTESARNKLKRDYYKAITEQQLNESQHQIMTLAKAKMDFVHFEMKVKKLIEKYGKVTVYLDEMDAMKTNAQSGAVTVYKSCTTFNCDLQQKALMDFLFKIQNVHVVLMSAEKGIDKALRARGIKPVLVDNFCTLIDYNLSIAYVSSTSKKKLVDENAPLFEVVSKIVNTHPDYTLVTNGLSETHKAILHDKGLTLSTHEGLKGHNDKTDTNFISIITYPGATEIQQYLLSIGIDDNNKKASDELEAIRAIVSNRYNQTIGRNTGYRGGSDSKHIAIIPIGLADLLDSYIVTAKHEVFDDVANAPDLELLTQLCKEELDEQKVQKGLEKLLESKRWYRNLLNKVFDNAKAQHPKMKTKRNELAKHFFAEYIQCKSKRIDGIPTTLYAY